MATTEIYLIGASGHAKVIRNNLELAGNKLTALLDDNRAVRFLNDLKVYHPVASCLDKPGNYIISIGNNSTRKTIAEKYALSYIKAIHPAAIIDSTVKIQEGTAVMAGVIINADTTIGSHVIINTSASIDHDCTIENFVHISPNATLSGNVKVGEGAHIGAGATIIQGISIGAWCTIGAGAVIIRDVPSGVTVVGNPGRIIK